MKLRHGMSRGQRRIVGYTLGTSAATIKEKLLRLLNCSTRNVATSTGGNSANKCKGISPIKGRPRANSQENILQMKDMDDSRSNNMLDEKMYNNYDDGPLHHMNREPLSQFVQHQMSVFNDDTQSE